MYVCTQALLAGKHEWTSGKGKGNTKWAPKYVAYLDKSRDIPSRRNRGSSSVYSPNLIHTLGTISANNSNSYFEFYIEGQLSNFNSMYNEHLFPEYLVLEKTNN